MLALTVIWNNGICRCICVSVCIYFISHYIYYFWLSLLLVFVSIESNSLDVKSDGFCFLKIWIYELLLINIKQRRVKKSTISAHELPYESLRILSIFRGKFFYLSPETVAVDVNVETLKENGILLTQFAQNVVEVCFRRNITGWDYLLRNWFKIKFLETWL